MARGDLHRYFLNNSQKQLYKWAHYFDVYERHFERFRGASPVMLEIGVSNGGSLAMWKDYFGPGCRIIGLDINPECKAHEAEGIEIFIGSQDDPVLLNNILSIYPKIDIVLDDGSHMMKHMIKSFKLLYERVQENGVYMVEDTHTCYWSQFEGGLKREGSFIEFVKDKFDEINAPHSKGAVSMTEFTKSTDYIACYDSMVVFERRRQGARQDLISKGMS